MEGDKVATERNHLVRGRWLMNHNLTYEICIDILRHKYIYIYNLTSNRTDYVRKKLSLVSVNACKVLAF